MSKALARSAHHEAAAGADPADDGTAKLPLRVVDRKDATAGPKRRRPRLVWLLRGLALLLVVFASILLGGIMGLYRQPPPLQAVMAILGLEPGGGTDSPVALPVERMGPNQPGGPPGGTGPATAPETVVGLGTLLPQGDVVTVAPPFGSGDARIASLEVEEGDRVEQGQTLAVLDNEEHLKAAVDAARATVAVREAALAQTRSSVHASLEEARAALARAQSAEIVARREFERAETLHERGFVSEAHLDDKRAVHQRAEREVEQAQATLSRFDAADLEAQSDVVVARRNLEAAQAELSRAERNLDQAQIRAPASGTVLDIHVRPGEKPAAEGVMEIGDIERMIAEVEVYQSEIGAVAPGDAVEITADALPEPLAGTVTRIGLEVGRQTLIDDDPAANTDARVVEVKVQLDEPSSRIASRFTNLQILARIAVGATP